MGEYSKWYPEDTTNYLAQVDELEVIEKCNCGDSGCETVNFRGWDRNTALDQVMVGDYTKDPEALVVWVFAHNKKIVMLEVVTVKILNELDE